MLKKGYGFDEAFNILMKQKIGAIKLMSVNLRVQIRLIKKYNARVFEIYRR